MTILVTGGAGFIGSNYIYYMLREHPGDCIVCIDSLTYAGNMETLNNARGNAVFRFYCEDICNATAIQQIFQLEQPDIVINFAAESHVDRSIIKPDKFIQSNIIGTHTLMDACLRYKVKRYHQVSTDEVYGDLPIDRWELKFTEKTLLNPSSPYSASKASADLLVSAYCRTYGLPATISRCSNNYGPYQFPEKLIPLMITNALQDKPLPVYGLGENIRNWIHVEDHCRAIDKIVRGNYIGETFNIGGLDDIRNIDVVKDICRIMDKPEHCITYIADRKGHDLRYSVEYTKINNMLGWSPKVKFDDGIRETIHWYVRHKEWWEPLLPKFNLVKNDN